MNETVRQYVTRRARWGHYVGIAGLALLILTGALLRGQEIAGTLVPFFFLLMMAGAVVTYLVARCPRCNGNLSAAPMNRPLGLRAKRADYCQYCGVHFDTPVAEARR